MYKGRTDYILVSPFHHQKSNICFFRPNVKLNHLRQYTLVIGFENSITLAKRTTQSCRDRFKRTVINKTLYRNEKYKGIHLITNHKNFSNNSGNTKANLTIWFLGLCNLFPTHPLTFKLMLELLCSSTLYIGLVYSRIAN